MRISDWSSDVCSSDLGFRSAARPQRQDRTALDAQAASLQQDIQCRARLQTAPHALRPFPRHQRAGEDEFLVRLASEAVQRTTEEIGRASWRERVGQYG